MSLIHFNGISSLSFLHTGYRLSYCTFSGARRYVDLTPDGFHVYFLPTKKVGEEQGFSV